MRVAPGMGLFFCDWLISLNIVSFSFTQVAVTGECPYLLHCKERHFVDLFVCQEPLGLPWPFSYSARRILKSVPILLGLQTARDGQIILLYTPIHIV